METEKSFEFALDEALISREIDLIKKLSADDEQPSAASCIAEKFNKSNVAASQNLKYLQNCDLIVLLEKGERKSAILTDAYKLFVRYWNE